MKIVKNYFQGERTIHLTSKLWLNKKVNHHSMGILPIESLNMLIMQKIIEKRK